jgi:hypothetical protein
LYLQLPDMEYNRQYMLEPFSLNWQTKHVIVIVV